MSDPILNQPGITICDTAVVMPFAYIGREPPGEEWDRYIEIGERSVIAAHVVVFFDVLIGESCRIGEHSTIREGCRIGDRVRIGANVTIDFGTEIGNDVQIMDGARIGARTSIGDSTYVGQNAILSSDRRIDPMQHDPRNPDARGPDVGKGCVIGAGANLLAYLKVGDGSVIAAGAIIADDVPAGSVFMGKKARRLASAR